MTNRPLNVTQTLVTSNGELEKTVLAFVSDMEPLCEPLDP